MKAIIYHAPGDIRVQDLPRPTCGADELLVAVDACAVCGTDLKSFKNGNPRIKPPLTMGHEFTGLIAEIGCNVRGFQTGQRIVMATSVSCGDCPYCKKGWPNLCANLAPMGFSYAGGMADFVVIPGRAIRNGHVIVVPPGLKPEYAALAEPVSCAVNCMDNCFLTGGETVAILGAGPMGLINAAVAKAMGASRIILSEVNPQRLEQARQFGVDLLLNPMQCDIVKAIKDATAGLGVDIAIVAAPAAQPQEIAPLIVRKRGVVCLFASLPAGKSNLTLDSRPIHYGELRVTGTSDSSPDHVRKAINLMATGKIPAEKLVTHILPWSSIHQAFDLMEKGQALRVVMVPEK